MNTFKKLETAVAELNQETDALNEVIRDFEDRLSTAGVGCETWLAAKFMEYEIGYSKVGGQWCVAVRRRESDEPCAILKMPRAVRVAACERLEELADQLVTIVESRLIDVRRAQRLAKEALK